MTSATVVQAVPISSTCSVVWCQCAHAPRKELKIGLIQATRASGKRRVNQHPVGVKLVHVADAPCARATTAACRTTRFVSESGCSYHWSWARKLSAWELPSSLLRNGIWKAVWDTTHDAVSSALSGNTSLMEGHAPCRRGRPATRSIADACPWLLFVSSRGKAHRPRRLIERNMARWPLSKPLAASLVW